MLQGLCGSREEVGSVRVWCVEVQRHQGFLGVGVGVEWIGVEGG